jgi:thymidylate synthase
MFIESRYLVEIMRKLYVELSKSTDTFEASKGKDLLGQKVVPKDPRARISATTTRGRFISALAKSGEYGHSINQIERVIDRLGRKPDTRRAVISILEPIGLTPTLGTLGVWPR